MPRNSTGTYSLPQPPFIPDTIISSGQVNSNFSDIATALSQSLATTGVSSMTGVIEATSGSALAPSYTFVPDTATGIYFTSSHTLNISSNGNQIVSISQAGLQVTLGNFLDSGGNIIGSPPVGTVVDYIGGSAPSRWLLCGGQAISRTTYSVLFALIGTYYGAGDGVTTFNLPDLRGRATYGVDNMGGSAAGRISVGGLNFDGTILGNSGGLQYHFLTTGEMPVHSHSINDQQHNHSPFFGFNFVTTGGGQDVGSASAPALNTNGQSTTTSSFTGITGTNNTGSGGAHTILGPAIMLNKIVFVGV